MPQIQGESDLIDLEMPNFNVVKMLVTLA